MEEEAEGEAETEEANAEGKAPGEGARGLALVLRVVVRIPEVNPMAVRTPPGSILPTVRLPPGYGNAATTAGP